MGRCSKAGIEIFEYNRTMLHHKTMVVDGVWVTIGTTNFDDRSFAHNEESNVCVFDRGLATELQQIFLEDRPCASESSCIRGDTAGPGREPRSSWRRSWKSRLDLQSAMLSRRAMLLAPVALMAAGRVSAAGKMTLAIHQNTSAGAGYRGSLEGWSRAGIKHVELTNTLLDEFLKTDSLPAARRVLTDLGLTPVSSACGVFGFWEPNPKRAAALDAFKKRCEQFAALGLTRIYSPTPTTEKFTQDDYTRARRQHA